MKWERLFVPFLISWGLALIRLGDFKVYLYAQLHIALDYPEKSKNNWKWWEEVKLE